MGALSFKLFNQLEKTHGGTKNESKYFPEQGARAGQRSPIQELCSQNDDMRRACGRHKRYRRHQHATGRLCGYS